MCVCVGVCAWAYAEDRHHTSRWVPEDWHVWGGSEQPACLHEERRGLSLQALLPSVIFPCTGRKAHL